MYPCRACRNAVHSAPLTATAAPSTTTESAAAPTSIAPASSTPVATSVRRSPTRAAMAPAGSPASSGPTLSSATRRAAVPTSAPSSRARRAMTGVTAPYPIAMTNDGPYAATAMSRNRNALVVGGTRPILPPQRRQELPLEVASPALRGGGNEQLAHRRLPREYAAQHEHHADPLTEPERLAREHDPDQRPDDRVDQPDQGDRPRGHPPALDQHVADARDRDGAERPGHPDPVRVSAAAQHQERHSGDADDGAAEREYGGPLADQRPRDQHHRDRGGGRERGRESAGQVVGGQEDQREERPDVEHAQHRRLPPPVAARQRPGERQHQQSDRERPDGGAEERPVGRQEVRCDVVRRPPGRRCECGEERGAPRSFHGNYNSFHRRYSPPPWSMSPTTSPGSWPSGLSNGPTSTSRRRALSAACTGSRHG